MNETIGSVLLLGMCIMFFSMIYAGIMDQALKPSKDEIIPTIVLECLTNKTALCIHQGGRSIEQLSIFYDKKLYLKINDFHIGDHVYLNDIAKNTYLTIYDNNDNLLFYATL